MNDYEGKDLDSFSYSGFGLASCGTSTNAVQATVQLVEVPAVTETSVPTESNAPVEKDTAATNRTLIVYFSPANSDSADFVSGATPRAGEVSSVEYIAGIINGQAAADIAKIVPSDPYPVTYNETADRAKSEQDQEMRPAFNLEVNPEDYDTIFVGYPVWWYHLPMIMQTFFDTYDLSGKTIIPFNTHAGSRDGGTYREIADLEPGATVLNGLAVAGDQALSADGDVINWLTGLSY